MRVSISAWLTPSFFIAGSGQPCQFGLKTLPWYCRSFHPMALEKNPAHRFERGNDLADALINFLSGASAHNEFRVARVARGTATVAAG